MTSLVRTDAWNSGGDFTNTNLFWYAKGVGKMMERSLNDPASWWFFAAIHGEYVNPQNAWYPSPPDFPAWTFIKAPPSVSTKPLPDTAIQQKYWNQCQHGSWYFLPWHRGYLLALEAQLRADIVSLGGPGTWALPYWNYFGGSQGSQAQMPPAFAQQAMPDGSANPLYVAMRYGPDADGNVYIPTDAWAETHPQDPNWSYGDVSSACLRNDLYTGSDPSTPLPGFGGPESSFSHSGSPHGNMESNPHDLVHVYAGGQISEDNYGLMADPGTAALDPIFYLHHCNIDRMWASWNAAGKANPNDPAWLAGPARPFVMPMPGGESWVYTPAQMNSTSTLNYTYQEVPALDKPASTALAMRLMNLGVDRARAAAAPARSPARPRAPAELLGASAGAVQVSGAGTGPIGVRLDAGVQKLVSQSLRDAAPSNLPDQVYLKLENVRGTLDATVLGVYVDLPEGASLTQRGRQHAGDVGLFGLRRASAKDGAHGGAGLTFVLDVSEWIDKLHLESKLAAGSVHISLLPRRELPGQSKIEVGRISLYRQPN
ncbi:MAG TPA: tyrosinase family protein [Albitalea sp.]|uniref:tyrosinase family protein n=1 Tax=Piscinibacter sp. TaxID=1903157 RepID=UPI002ED3BA15